MNTPSSTRRVDGCDDRKHAGLVQEMSQLIRKALVDAILPLDVDGDQSMLTIERANRSVGPAWLARKYPGGVPARRQVCELYERCLKHYREVVRAPYADAGRDDVGAAVACFVAANIHALRGVEVTPRVLLKLKRQLGTLVQRSAAWASVSKRERQRYFEQVAILAVLIAESSAQAVQQGSAAVANVQSAARGYLQQLLGLNPDCLTVGPDGIELLPQHEKLAVAVAGYSV